MGSNSSVRRLLFAAVIISMLATRWAVAQTSTPGASGANGVVIDGGGVLRLQHFADPNGQLTKKRLAEAKARLNPRVATPSDLRKVSLNRLEAAIRAELAQGRAPTEDMQYLAEGWVADPTGRACGLDSGRPILQLQDLVVALRAYAPGRAEAPAILVSIDPTPEGLSRMQQFLRSVGSHATPAETQMIVDGLRTNLGMQNIRVAGVAPNTHFAQVLLECDYRMKLIGIGLEKPPVKMVSYIDRATPSTSRSALQRWYFVPDYNCVRVAADSLGLELVGDVVKLVGEDQMVGKDGVRSVSGKGNKASDLFTTAFTKKYAELASRVPVFAEMRNCIDLAIGAAFIHQQDFYSKAEWQAATFNDEGALAVQTGNTPLQVETVCTAVWKGNNLMTPVGGGVTIHPRQALATKNLLPDNDGKVTADRWWWD